MGLERAQEMVQGKPLDAADIQTLDEAKEEIRQLRVLIQGMIDSSSAGGGLGLGKTKRGSADSVPDRGAKAPGARGRAAVFASIQKVEDYHHKVIEKPEETSELILRAIEQSVLFKNCGRGDLAQLVEAFSPVEFPAGAQVITQNEAGDDFYVVETGSLRCFVAFPSSPEEVEVRTPYIRGESFGELALMYNNPRAATLRAAEDCKLWSIKRGTVRAILTSRREETMAQRIKLLSNVVIGDVNLKSMLSKGEVEQLVNALEEEEFSKGECIVRQGETGHSFYILQSGEISVHQKASADTVPAEGDGDCGMGPQVATLSAGSYFGERALMSEETREATCVASNEGGAVCLSLGRDDFSRMLGSLEDVMAKAAGIKRPSSVASAGHGDHHISINPEDLESIRSLGQGAFGNVKLVLHRPTGRAFALKCQGKKAIVENELQQHILDERRLLMELDHPFILKLHDSFQDDRYVYFVLEVLMGGEIFTHLRRAGSFEESAVKFFAATVVCALEHMHERFIVYRDLKPENLVLDDKGYIKIVDLGLAKVLPTGYTWTICGTPDYLAPEIILNEGHDQAVDFWALGVLIYEMLAGVAPFYADDPMSTYENILASRVQPPSFFSKSIKDIIRKLLKINKSKRLGKTAGGAGAVMKQKWFSGFDWDGLLNRKLEVPIDPKLSDPLDASNFNPPAPAQEESEPCPDWTPDF